MLNISDDHHFSIIEIKPSKYSLQVSQIKNDSVTEITNRLHNYLDVNKINIEPDNILGTYQADPLGIPNLQTFEADIKEAGLIVGLE